MTDPAKADWTLFQSLLPQWQERFMSRLCDKYAAVLTGPYRGSEAFWEVKRLIRQDVKRIGAMGGVEQSEMADIIADLLREQVITAEDLADFSDEVKETVEWAAMIQRKALQTRD